MFRPGNLGHIGRLGLMSASQATLLQQAIAAIRRNNGTLFYVPSNFAGSWTDSAGTDPVNEVADVIGRMTDRTGGSAVATQATTANKPTVQTNAQGRYAMSFDGSNDFLQTGITTGNEGWVCAGVTFDDTSLQSIASSGAGSAAEKGIWPLMLNTGGGGPSVLAQVGNGTTRAQSFTPAVKNAPSVVSIGWSTAGVFAGSNNTEATPVTLPTGDLTGPFPLKIGIYRDGVTGPSKGPMTAQVICPVLPSAADRAIIRKWIGSLQGQSL